MSEWVYLAAKMTGREDIDRHILGDLKASLDGWESKQVLKRSPDDYWAPSYDELQTMLVLSKKVEYPASTPSEGFRVVVGTNGAEVSTDVVSPEDWDGFSTVLDKRGR